MSPLSPVSRGHYRSPTEREGFLTFQQVCAKALSPSPVLPTQKVLSETTGEIYLHRAFVFFLGVSIPNEFISMRREHIEILHA